MAKKIQTTIKLQLPAGKATPAPPVGTALGPHGLNIMDFCKQFNAKTGKEPDGMIFPVLLTVYTDRTFTFILKTPPASVLLKRAANIAKGSAEPNRNKVGKVTKKQVMEIAKIKLVEARPYKLGEAAELLKKTHHTKFNETVELAINLGVDPKHSDQVVRGTVGLPNGLGKTVRVLVIAGGEKVREAQEAGADFVGGDEIVQKIMEGWTDYDAVIATPDMMRSAGKLGKVLGPRGLMPNPKTGTVTFEVAKAIKEVKAGKVEFRVDKAGIVHCPIGKIQFDGAKLAENAHAVIEAVVKAKPAAAKGKYVKKITLTSTMGPGITIDLTEVEAMAAAA